MSYFGGSSLNKNEPKFKTAIREGYEELSGLLGTKKELENLVKNNYIEQYSNDRYTSYIFNIEYDEPLPKYFNKNYEFVKNTTPSIINTNDNGLYEKKEIRWVTVDEIYKLEFRPFYRKIILPIVKNI